MEIILFILGALFILASLFLTYKQDRDTDINTNSDFEDSTADYLYLNKELKKREQRLSELLANLNNGLDNALNGLEIKQEKLDNSSTKETYSNFSNALNSRLNVVEDSDLSVEKLNSAQAQKSDSTLATESSQQTENSSITEEVESESKEDKYHQIAELSAQGLDYTQIAKRLNLGQREVELILKFDDRGDK
ncbi:DUF6115 domain-containing protein [Fuchsiella alkaliacetigena]|uniref:DUF6115 domain-containing protein n=1 Tax=Fuchsiella alkaliacetigena TaxID=957042 RepID=UPI00200B6F2C|nr:hypothetical protein [Fuchsiella alkaliacetigena]MCK8823523.1 hypothetical protein [Fuchsiella alkaliacetigena]